MFRVCTITLLVHKYEIIDNALNMSTTRMTLFPNIFLGEWKEKFIILMHLKKWQLYFSLRNELYPYSSIQYHNLWDPSPLHDDFHLEHNFPPRMSSWSLLEESDLWPQLFHGIMGIIHLPWHYLFQTLTYILHDDLFLVWSFWRDESESISFEDNSSR